MNNLLYETPEHYLRFLASNISLSGNDSTFLEPCNGRGAISNYFINHNWVTNDIDKNLPAEYHEDATWPMLYRDIGEYDYAITNPPYNEDCYKIISRSFEKAKKGGIYLTRLSFHEPCEHRKEWLNENKEHLRLLLIMKRYSFKGKNKDNITCCWSFWDKEYHGLTTIKYQV